MNFCVLFASRAFSLSSIHRREDIDRLLADTHAQEVFIAETGLQEIHCNISLELMPAPEEAEGTEPAAAPAALCMLLPSQLTTDAMAKEHTIDLKHCTEPWSTGSVHSPRGRTGQLARLCGRKATG